MPRIGGIVGHALRLPRDLGRDRNYTNWVWAFPKSVIDLSLSVTQRGRSTTLGFFGVAVAYVATATEGRFWMFRFLPQREASATYNLTADYDVNAVGAHAERTRTQIVYVLATIDPEV